MHAHLQDHGCRLRAVIGDLESRTDFHECLSARQVPHSPSQAIGGVKVPMLAHALAVSTTFTATCMARWSEAFPMNVPVSGIASRGSCTTATRTRFSLPIAPLDGSKSTQPGPGI